MSTHKWLCEFGWIDVYYIIHMHSFLYKFFFTAPMYANSANQTTHSNITTIYVEKRCLLRNDPHMYMRSFSYQAWLLVKNKFSE